MDLTPDELSRSLAHHTGTTKWYRFNPFRRVLLTDGTFFLATEAGAHWLCVAIAIYITHARIKEQEFTSWTLAVREDRSAELSATDGRSDRKLITQQIPYTDFLLREIKLFMTWDGEHYVILLPSEY